MSKKVTLQEMIIRLQHYWAEQGCLLMLPYDVEKGAGTFNPSTFLRVLGPEPWNAGYVEPSRRPKDGRYGENPNRLYQHFQYQVVMKPAPLNIQELYLGSLRALGVEPKQHDLRFDEDDWESPTIGAWGLGWQVILDGMEVTQFTYFQQMGGLELDPVTVEITYGLERLGMYIQEVDSVFELEWAGGVTYGELRQEEEREFSRHGFELADVKELQSTFKASEKECLRLLKADLPMPAYDYLLKSCHSFNVLEARGAISVSERTTYIGHLRGMAKAAAEGYLKKREALGYPLLKEERK